MKLIIKHNRFLWGVYMKNMDETYYINIRDTLVFREGTVRVDADGNLLSLAVLSEGFYRELLNMLMGWNLINANIEEKNAPGIDLIDKDQKIAVQVSLTCDHEKVQHSIDKFKQESYEGWHFFFVPIKRDSPRFRKDFTLPQGVIFNEKKDVLSISRILDIVAQEADIDKKRSISLHLDKYTKESGQHLALCKRLYSRLKAVREAHPSFVLMDEDGIDKLLFPHSEELIPALGTVNGNVAPIWDHIKAEHKEGFRHIIIEGDGGIGKSVSLLSVTDDTELLTRIPAIYIHMYDLVYGGNCLTLPDFLAHDADFKEINNLCREGGDPKLMMLLDGLNEVAYEHQGEMLRSIKQWAVGHQGAQLIIASRPIPGRQLEYLLGKDALHIRLKGIGKKRAKERLVMWGIPIPDDSSRIWETLKFPLFLTLYAKTANLPEKTSSGYPLDVHEPVGQASLIWNYLQREMLRKNEALWPVSCAITCEYIAPYIAYKMAMENKFELGHDEAEELVEEAIKSMDLNVLPKHLEKVNRNRRHNRKALPQEDWETFVLEESGVFVAPKRRMDNEKGFKDKNTVKGQAEDDYSFMHQNFRDCLAGLHLVNSAQMADDILPEEWKVSVRPEIMDYVAELMDPQTASALWEINRVYKRYRGTPSQNNASTYMQLELNRRLSTNGDRLNFSGMDLRGMSLTSYMGLGKNYPGLFSKPELSNETHFDMSVFESSGHHGPVNCILELDDGRIVTGSDDGTIRIWDPNTGECFMILRKGKHPSSVRCLEKLENGCIVSGHTDHTLRIWNIDEGKCLAFLHGHSKRINCLVILRDGRIVSGSNDKTIRIWDPNDGNSVLILEGHLGPVINIIELEDGRLASCAVDNTPLIWDSRTGKCLFVLKGHSGLVNCLSELPGKKIVSASHDNSLRIWDTKNGRCLATLRGHYDSVLCLTEGDDNEIISGSSDNSICIWNLKTRQCVAKLRGHSDRILSVSILSNGCIVSSSKDRTVRIWNKETGECLGMLSGHSNRINCVSELQDGRIVSGSSDYSVRIWNVDTFKCCQNLNGSLSRINYLTPLHDGRIIISTCDTTLRLWNPDGKKRIICSEKRSFDRNRTVNCVYELGRGYIIGSTLSNVIHIWSEETLKHLFYFKGHKKTIDCLLELYDGRIISGSRDRNIRIWSMKQKKKPKVLRGHSSWVTCLALLPNGRIVSGSADQTLRIWDPKSGKCTKVLQGHTNWINCLVVLPNGQIVSGSADGTIRKWSGESGECLLTFAEYCRPVRCLALLSKGRLVSCSDDKTLRIWDTETGECIKTLNGHTARIKYLAILPDERIVSGSTDNSIRIWNSITGECLTILKGHYGQIDHVSVLQDGRIVCESDENTISLWDPNTGRCLNELKITEVDVSDKDLTKAIMYGRAATLLYQNGAKIPSRYLE